MQAYNHTTSHQPSSKYQYAYGLSRLPIICGVVNEADRFHQLLITGDFSQEDDKNQTLIRQLHKNTMVKENQLYKKVKGHFRLYQLPSSRPALVCQAYSLIGHANVKKTIALLQKDYYWECMYFNVEASIRGCLKCQ